MVLVPHMGSPGEEDERIKVCVSGSLKNSHQRVVVLFAGPRKHYDDLEAKHKHA